MPLISLAALISAVAYLGVTGYAIYEARRATATGYWLVAVSVWSLLFTAALALDGFNGHLLNYAPGIWLTMVSLGGICLLGGLTFSYLNLKAAWAWLFGMLPLIGLVFIVDVVDSAPGLLEFTWRSSLTEKSVSSVLAAIALILVGVGLLIFTLRETARARLPLYANRGLYWALMLPVLMAGEAMAVWGPDIVSAIGQGLRLAALLGLAYGATTRDLVDVRGLFRGVIGNALFIAFTAIVSLLGISAAVYIFQKFPDEGWALVIILAIVLALVYQAVRSLLDQVIKEAVFKSGYDTATLAAEYSKSVAQLLDIKELAAALGKTMEQSVEATKFGLLLMTGYRDNVRAEVFVGSGTMPEVGHRFPAVSPFFEALVNGRKPLLQYTLDTAEQFTGVLAIDRRWLQKLGSDVYVPILDGDNLTGILAIGPRKSRDPYRARDLELFQAIADQTAVALANARLVTDLKASNEEVLAQKQALAENNVQLKEMDRVKTDFITIASHELRTPLTQILGYADLLSMLSEAPTVPGPEIAPITESVLKAGNRLNEIVGQMLDVSQLDSDVIQLNLTETTVDDALHAVMETYESALQERHIILTANGIRALPPLIADPQRLAQALKAVVGNAIKYTPDGGSIEVRGRQLKERNQPEAIEICVADTGIGIDSKHLELIFDKFFRVGGTATHSTSATNFMGAGPGLGLSIAKGIVEGHGGRMWAKSPGTNPPNFPGTEIYIQLPLKATPPASNSKVSF